MQKLAGFFYFWVSFLKRTSGCSLFLDQRGGGEGNEHLEPFTSNSPTVDLLQKPLALVVMKSSGIAKHFSTVLFPRWYPKPGELS